jgi:hypothetical protein
MTPGLMPAGHRYGQGAESVRPYLRDAWRSQPNNPVFTAQDIVSLVWPAGRQQTHNASTRA